MGCIASKPAADSPDSAEEKPEAKGSANQGQDAADTKEVNIGMGSQSSADQGFVDEGFVAWSEMEAAEEQDYLVDEEKDSQLDQALEKMYSDRHRKHERSYNDPAFWHNIMTSIEPEPDGFHLTAPFTLRKAHLLYRYLRSGNAQPLPRKFLYEAPGSGDNTRATPQPPRLLLDRVPAPHAPFRWPWLHGVGSQGRPPTPCLGSRVPLPCRYSTGSGADRGVQAARGPVQGAGRAAAGAESQPTVAPPRLRAPHSMPLHLCTSAPLHLCTRAPVHPCTRAPAHPGAAPGQQVGAALRVRRHARSACAMCKAMRQRPCASGHVPAAMCRRQCAGGTATASSVAATTATSPAVSPDLPWPPKQSPLTSRGLPSNLP